MNNQSIKESLATLQKAADQFLANSKSKSATACYREDQLTLAETLQCNIDGIAELLDLSACRGCDEITEISSQDDGYCPKCCRVSDSTAEAASEAYASLIRI